MFIMRLHNPCQLSIYFRLAIHHKFVLLISSFMALHRYVFSSKEGRCCTIAPNTCLHNDTWNYSTLVLPLLITIAASVFFDCNNNLWITNHSWCFFVFLPEGMNVNPKYVYCLTIAIFCSLKIKLLFYGRLLFVKYHYLISLFNWVLDPIFHSFLS